MNERLKLLRKTLHLNQTAFGQRIGLTQPTIAGYESGNFVPPASTIIAICKEYNVNESWLRTGEGDMFRPVSRDEEIAAFVGDILGEESDFRRRFVAVLARMTAAEWELLERKARELLEDTKKDG